MEEKFRKLYFAFWKWLRRRRERDFIYRELGKNAAIEFMLRDTKKERP